MRRKIILFLLILFTSFGVSVWSQVQKMKFTIKDMLSINVPSQIDISPDGKFVVLFYQKLILKKANTGLIFTLFQPKQGKSSS